MSFDRRTGVVGEIVAIPCFKDIDRLGKFTETRTENDGEFNFVAVNILPEDVEEVFVVELEIDHLRRKFPRLLPKEVLKVFRL